MNVQDIRDYFQGELSAGRFTIDKTGVQTIELIGASFIADEAAIFGTPSLPYIAAELKWYESGSTNINDIHGPDRQPPEAWKYAADRHGNINSNYGHLIYSAKYNTQYENVLKELIDNRDSRRGTMVYTRPTIWNEYCLNGMSDFICTNAVTYYIRDNQLHAVVQMRSNDAIFGYKNDYAWQLTVMENLVYDYNEQAKCRTKITLGNMHWQVQNLHVYARHFDLVK